MPEEGSTTYEEMHNGPGPMQRALDSEGITPIKLARLLRAGLRAKITKTMKVKGALDQTKLPKGFRVVAVTGTIIKDIDGNPVAGDGETVIAWDETSNEERRANRIDAQRLRGAYPPEVKQVKGRIDIRIIEEFPEEEPSGEPTT